MRNINLLPFKNIPILNIADLLGLQIKGKKALCFNGHDKRSRSLSFVPAKNIWKCFGCGEKGDGISLVMSVLKCDFSTALKWLSDKFNLHVSFEHKHRRKINKQSPLVLRKPILKEAKKEFFIDSEIYTWLINKCGIVSKSLGVQYLKNHGISLETANHFVVRELCDPARAFREIIKQWGNERVFQSGLAWGSDGKAERLLWTSYSLLFPFYSEGRVAYLQGRLFHGEPKFLGLRGIDKPIYNLERISSLKRGSIVHICEGIPDALALENHNIPSVGILGASSFRQEWVDIFKKYDVVLMPDGDNGGKIFRQTIKNLFKARGKDVRSVQMPIGKKDVADVIAAIGEISE
ncbi:MAG: CHC2 zinc finger domain-containing protein [Bacteroidota bacterium]|nr:CHC2 zinc finger domain-containing protein [Bacteroidota bacterium]